MEQVQDRSRAGFATLDRYLVSSGGRFVTFDRYQHRSQEEFVTLHTYFQGAINDVARVCSVDRVQSLLQGSDSLRYRDGTRVYLVAKNVRFAA